MVALPSDPHARQKLMLGLLVVLGLGYFGYQYVYSPRAAEVRVLQERLETLEMQNDAARALTRGPGTEDVEEQLALYRDQLVTVEGLIPLSEELPDLLDAISAEAQRTGVELSLIQPVGATDEGFYTRRIYDVAVLGAYHDIGEFLTRVASLPRIITPINLVLTTRPEEMRDGRPQLEARFSIETYVLPLTDTSTDMSDNAE